MSTSEPASIEEFIFQVADIKYSKDGFHVVRTLRGESVSGKFAARLGHCYKAEGKWETHAVYGPQYKLESAVMVRMTTPEALGRFLSLQLKGKGVGEAVIGSLVEACVAENLDLEDMLNKRQREELIECVGKRNAKKVEILLEIWPKIKPASDLIAPLLGYGLSEAMAEAALALWGKSAVEKVEDEPYDLILRLSGVSFLTADKIAMRVGRVRKTDAIRLRAAFSTGIRDATTSGDIGVKRKDLIKKTMPLVNECITENGRRKLAPGVPPVVSEQILAEALDEMINGIHFDAEGEKCGFSSNLMEFPDEKGEVVIWYTPLVRAEENIARRLAKFRALPRLDLVARVSEFEAKMKSPLDADQRLAVETALSHPVVIITGGPGTGKSYMLKVLLAAFDAAGQKGALAAPTGKAAKRISEATGRKAQTQHSLIGFSGGGGCMFDETCPLSAHYLVIDEASMDDTELLASTLMAAPDDCRIIFLGDVDQLASVGPGQCLRDMIRSGVLPVVRLTTGHRFSGGIKAAAREVNAGLVPESSADGQFHFIESDDPRTDLMEQVKKLLASGVSGDDIQVLSPTHAGDAGCNQLNVAMQELLNPAPEGGTNQRLKRDGGDIRVNDRVLQTKNDKELMLVNGDVGWLVGMESDTGRLSLLLPDQPKPISMMPAQATHLKLAYSITVHKSQGAEAPYIIIAIDPAASFMMRRSLVYTGLTRGIKQVFLIASRSIVSIAVRKGEPPEGSRRTSLVPKLIAAFAGVTPKIAAPVAKPDILAEAMRVPEFFDDI